MKDSNINLIDVRSSQEFEEGHLDGAVNIPVYKIEIDRKREHILIGQVTLSNSANRNFTVRRYLLPIAQSFLETREAYGLDHEQNEGW